MCRVAIVVFTKTYAESAWCLHELQQIIKWHDTYCRHVLPVYYEIQPSDVRLQKGDFGKSLKATAKQTFSGQQVEDALSRWSRALTKAANFFGWDESNYRSDADLVDKIVKSVLNLPVLSATKFPVGLQFHVENVTRMIENKSTEVSIIGIWGMRGLGKTTLVKSIKSVAMGASMIQERFSGKRVLIVLNDANPFRPLEDLCRNSKWFGQGTVIIITTRDVNLLDGFNVNYVYKMSNMNENDSLELFSWHAFREEKPIEDFNGLAKKVVANCGGLPLALEVLGSYLSERTKKEWKIVLSKLEIIPNIQVKEKLRICLDGLGGDMEKDIFLDVCCFFIGKDRGYVTEILNGCGLHADKGITVLIERGLLKVEKNNKLGMHHLLRDMGIDIILGSSTTEREKRNRLWFTEDATFLLTKNMGSEAIQGWVLKSPLPIESSLEICAFKDKLILGLLDSLLITGDYPNLSKQLSNLRRVWKEPRVLGWLKFLNLSHSKYLKESPNFSGLPSLEQLILKDCPRLCKVHQSIGDLCNLLLINLKDCISLSNLPKEVYKLKSLKTLILSGCAKIDILEEDIVQMESLITLIAEYKAVKQVPFSIVSSKCIGYISLSGFEGLSHNIFPSIIRSWMSPTMNLLSYINPFCVDMENNNWRELAPLFSNLANLRSISVQCDTELQLSKQVKSILVEYRAEFKELSISKPHVWFSLLGRGRYNEFFNTLSDSISEVPSLASTFVYLPSPFILALKEHGINGPNKVSKRNYNTPVFAPIAFIGLARSESSDVCLPGDPHLLAHVGEGHSVCFTLPQDCDLKGMALCVVYLSTPENMATECLTSVLIVNYTKCTFQVHKHGTVICFNDIDWEGIISNLKSGDKVEIFVTLAHGLVVKNTAVYLKYGESKKNAPHKFKKKIVRCDF
ncbi:unnamed protein product [Sphenostylis stenocarpa]|uniref:TIR domain-containing protein n=1 Tax=Sphenostylis stenocarpa TaxID=92480 RepID=A0AA86VJ49_9FABA|nr:unnamed protein product [Sphenostylis stenocarpa]